MAAADLVTRRSTHHPPIVDHHVDDHGPHVGNGHQHVHLLIRQDLGRGQLVQIQGIIVVNG